MALYIEIRKVRSTDSEAEYEFTYQNHTGRLLINTLNGDVQLLQAIPGTTTVFEAVAYKLKKLWQTGSLPDQTCWAS